MERLPASGGGGRHRRYGIVLAVGPGITPGAIDGANIVDLAPTALHAMGMPVPGDMDGRVLTELFSDGRDVETSDAAGSRPQRWSTRRRRRPPSRRRWRTSGTCDGSREGPDFSLTGSGCDGPGVMDDTATVELEDSRLRAGSPSLARCRLSFTSTATVGRGTEISRFAGSAGITVLATCRPAA